MLTIIGRSSFFWRHMNPTDEQVDCIYKFKSGGSLRVNALAGTGKTSVLSMMSGQTKMRGTYLAFNKSIAEESTRKFPSNISCSTQHSLAFRAVRSQYSSEKLVGNLNGGFIASKMDLKPFEITPQMSLLPRGVGHFSLQTVKRWCSSGRPEMNIKDVPIEGRLKTLEEDATHRFRCHIFKHAVDLWERMIDADNPIPLGHDGYLKVWALSDPVLPGKFVLLDEAQDSSGVIIEIMKNQPGQVIFVGDENQAIYEWRNARNAMKLVQTDNDARLSKSFRFGHEIAAYASRILYLIGNDFPLTGSDGKPGHIGVCENPDAILCRTNSKLIGEIFKAIDRDLNPFIVGGVKELLDMVAAAEKLMCGKEVEYPLDFFGFKNWDEVRTHSMKEEGKELKGIVNTIDQYGTAELRKVLERLPKEESRSNLILSTAHKSKGREWRSVSLGDDFLMPPRPEDGESEDKGIEKRPPDSEFRLFYVACTRAMKNLEVPEEIMERVEKYEQEDAMKQSNSYCSSNALAEL